MYLLKCNLMNYDFFFINKCYYGNYVVKFFYIIIKNLKFGFEF